MKPGTGKKYIPIIPTILNGAIKVLEARQAEIQRTIDCYKAKIKEYQETKCRHEFKRIPDLFLLDEAYCIYCGKTINYQP